jgi:aldehyde dehydrogenase (NAD+)
MIADIVSRQREYFLSGATLSLSVRKENLQKLRKLILAYRTRFDEAFLLDFNKSEFDVLTTEIYLVLQENAYQIHHLRKLAKTRRVKTSLVNFPSHGYLMQEPYGVTLILSPWNYPLQLALEPLMGALAAGNTVILKPASYAAHVSQVIADMVAEFGNPGLLAVVQGGRQQNQDLLEQKFDYIFFTGGAAVGKLVLQKAAEHLTPVSLELGGKSPCVVDADADVDLAARRIVWGKFLNAGQTCVAPDYIEVAASVHDEFIRDVRKYIQQFFYSEGKLSSDFPHLINEKHAEKVLSLITPSKIIIGGKAQGLCLEPTVMDDVTDSDPCMAEEIFGPVMPILTFERLDELLPILERREKPLAFYYFSRDKRKAKKVFNALSFGGGCFNETILHLSNDSLPFGGVGRSGMGAYHGDASFKTFSHQKSVLWKGRGELSVKYPPVTPRKLKLIKKITGIKD